MNGSGRNTADNFFSSLTHRLTSTYTDVQLAVEYVKKDFPYFFLFTRISGHHNITYYIK